MGKIKNLLTKDDPWYFAFIRDFLISLAILGIVIGGIYLYSGVWPPMVAVESGSMKPNIQVGDVVFVVEGKITTYREGVETGFSSFGRPGNVIIFNPPLHRGAPIIHRAMYWVEEGERMWDDGPIAPHSGYITKGDNNQAYDQMSVGLSYNEPIKKKWIIGKAKYKIPFIGKIRLFLESLTGEIHHYSLETQCPYTRQLPQ